MDMPSGELLESNASGSAGHAADAPDGKATTSHGKGRDLRLQLAKAAAIEILWLKPESPKSP